VHTLFALSQISLILVVSDAHMTLEDLRTLQMKHYSLYFPALHLRQLVALSEFIEGVLQPASNISSDVNTNSNVKALNLTDRPLPSSSLYDIVSLDDTIPAECLSLQEAGLSDVGPALQRSFLAGNSVESNESIAEARYKYLSHWFLPFHGIM
jgi:hypothetical protein